MIDDNDKGEKYAKEEKLIASSNALANTTANKLVKEYNDTTFHHIVWWSLYKMTSGSVTTSKVHY